jgi:hypothetical protein
MPVPQPMSLRDEVAVTKELSDHDFCAANVHEFWIRLLYKAPFFRVLPTGKVRVAKLLSG